MLQAPGIVLDGLHEALDHARRVDLVIVRMNRGQGHFFAVRRHDHREEGAFLPADGNHAMRNGRAVERRVARLERLLVLADPQTHLPAQDVIVFLAAVRGCRDRLTLEGGGIVVCHEVRRRLPIAEERRHVANLNSGLARRHDALAGARHLQISQLGRMAFKKGHQIDTEHQRALMQERKRRIALGGLNGAALGLGHARLRGQFRNRETFDLAHFANARRNALESFLCFNCIHGFVLSDVSISVVFLN